MTTYTGHWMAVDSKGNNQNGGEISVWAASMAGALYDAARTIRKQLGADPIGLSVVLTREDG